MGLQPTPTQAEALIEGHARAVAHAASNLLKPLRNNFVERPWGGMAIRGFKGLYPLPDQPAVTGVGLGEAFEIAAYDEDAEARRHPSRLRFGDGSQLSLPRLLERRAGTILGDSFTERYGACVPLLPKTLDIKELLSVQGHPEGNTEVYIIIDAEPGATIRVGFSRDIDSADFAGALKSGRQQQEALVSSLGDVDLGALQGVMAPWLGERGACAEQLGPAFRERLGPGEGWAVVAELLEQLKSLYWRVLDSMNAIPVAPGQVIHNATPPRVLEATGKAPSAEVHALGNPEGKEILALEIRRPGPTFRAWDNVRFPIRDLDVKAAVAALNMSRTEPEDFLIRPVPIAGRPGALCSVDSEAYRIEHLRPDAKTPVAVSAEQPHCLHAIRGRARVLSPGGSFIDELQQGESALVPIGVGAYRVSALSGDTEIVKVSLPLHA